MDAALVGAIFTGVIGLITTIGGLMLSRQRQRVDSVLDLETDVHDLRRQVETALVYIHELRLEMARHGHTPPDMPDELTARRRRHRAQRDIS